MRLWLWILLVFGCGGSNGNLPGQDESREVLQQSQTHPASKGAQGSAGETAAVEARRRDNSGGVQREAEPEDEPEPELELELDVANIAELEPARSQSSVTSVIPLPPVKPCQKSPSTADEIISRMKCEYRSIPSYQDIGELQYFIDGNRDTILFETHFVRPDKFHFEFTSHHPYPPLHHLTTTHTIWARAGQVYTTSGKRYSIAMAVAGFTGISKMAAPVVPALLMRLMPQNPWISSNSPARKLGDDYLDGTACYRVAIETRIGAMELWIGRLDFLLRKVKMNSKKMAAMGMTGWEMNLGNIDSSSPILDSVFVEP